MDSLELKLTQSVKRCEFHPVQRRLYTYDLLILPSVLKRFVKAPLAVVQPENDEEVLETLKIARNANVPVVPRGAATSAYGGVLPIRDCIVIDFTRMNRIEVKNSGVVAEAGAIWCDVEKELNKSGLALRVYPTSAPVSTVGGWIAQGGYGVGSLKYGSIAENIEWLEVADFNGVKRVSGEDIKYYVGTHGTTGLILRACLKVRTNAEIKSVAVSTSFDKAVDLIDGAYHAAYLTDKFLGISGWKYGNILLACFEDEASVEGDTELGEFLWRNRFMQLRAARFGRVVFSEALLPYDRAAEFLEKCSKLGAAVEVIFAKDWAVFFGVFRAEKFYSSLLNALKFVKIAEKFDGRVYSTGLLFPHKKVFGRDVAEFKAKVDPKNLLNPGKALQGNAISNIVRIAEMIV